jgi:hypothetical protein
MRPGKVYRQRIREICWALLVTLLCSHATFPQSNLPPAVQADLLRDQIYAEAKALDFDGVLKSIDQYRKLALPFPPPLLWLEAKAAHDSGDAQRALHALEEFLATTERSSEKYKEALALYPTYQQIIASAKQQEADARRASLVGKIPGSMIEMESHLVSVPGGEFLQASAIGRFDVTSEQGHPNFQGRAILNVKGFKILKTGVKAAWWAGFLADTGRQIPEGLSDARDSELLINGKNPASSKDVEEFAAWVTTKTGMKLRLPSEAELELIDQRASGRFKSSEDAAKADGEVTIGGDNASDTWLVADCWHKSSSGAPKDGAPWKTKCDDPARFTGLRIRKRASEGDEDFLGHFSTHYYYRSYQIDRVPADIEAGYFTYHVTLVQD